MVSYGCLIPVCIASNRRGCEPTGMRNANGKLPSASQNRYKVDLSPDQSFSNGIPRFDNDTVYRIRRRRA